MKKIFALVTVFCVLAAPVLADAKTSGTSPTPGERIANETANAVADVLTGQSSGEASGEAGTPPGLAKKGGTPPGLAKKGGLPPGQAKKPNWKRDHPNVDSPIDTFVKALFGQKK